MADFLEREPVLRLRRRCRSERIFCIALLLALALEVQAAGAADSPLPRMSPAQVVSRINLSWQCTRYTIIGLCYCGIVPCGYQVMQYVPAAFIETTRTPGETMVASLDFSQLVALGAGFAIGGHTRQINQGGKDNTYEAHVYAMPEHVAQMANGCRSCKVSTAEAPEAGALWPRDPDAGLCGSIGDIVAMLSSFADVGALSGYSLSLRYSSEADALQWRTGCRDFGLVNLLRSNGWTCSAAGGAEFPGAPALAARLLGADACIGAWGPNFPRQMRTRGPDEVRSSAIAAYRALSLARTDLATFPFPVDTTGKLQQAYPAVSQCVRIGETPVLPSDMRRSSDGAYGWIYWRPTLCCVPFDVTSNC